MKSNRSIVYNILYGVYVHKDYINLALRKELETLDKKQRPFVTQLVYGTLEHFQYVRYCWEDLTRTKTNQKLEVLLDMSVYELLFMEQSDAYAIVYEAVELTKQIVSKKHASFVNAILRRVQERGKRELPSNEWEALSIATSHPLWLISMWKAQYGEEACKKICYENCKPRKAVARVNTLKISRDALIAKDHQFEKTTQSEDGVIYHGGSIVQTTWFQEGYLQIQDEASQLVVQCLDVKPYDKVLDVCSAPGTKAIHMAQKMKNLGEICCFDLHKHRVKLIETKAQELQISILHAVTKDATNLADIEDGQYDKILCDVPCSGYGTLSGKSDIKMHMKSTDMDTLIPIQYQILKEASKKLKVNGDLVYSTCTLNRKENEKQMERFLKEHTSFACISMQTIFPYEFQSHGFFMAKLRRMEE